MSEMTAATRTALPPVFERIDDLRARLGGVRADGDRIVLVPTMGALHAGHRALVDRARELGEYVVVSIFVNPLQFGPSEDLDRYPRTLETDLAALAGRADAVFAPSVSQMYPDGPTATRISAGEAGTVFEGASRPGHFDGMLTVVAKLLNIVQPSFAMFGQKDAQQVYLVQRMVHDLNLPVSIEAVPTVRESDGLALSSRNRYLAAPARAASVEVFSALADAADARQHGVEAVLAAARSRIEAEPAVKLDYLVAVDPATFLPVHDGYRGPVTLLLAAAVGEARLIDNAQLLIE